MALHFYKLTNLLLFVNFQLLLLLTTINQIAQACDASTNSQPYQHDVLCNNGTQYQCVCYHGDGVLLKHFRDCRAFIKDRQINVTTVRLRNFNFNAIDQVHFEYNFKFALTRLLYAFCRTHLVRCAEIDISMLNERRVVIMNVHCEPEAVTAVQFNIIRLSGVSHPLQQSDVVQAYKIARLLRANSDKFYYLLRGILVKDVDTDVIEVGLNGGGGKRPPTGDDEESNELYIRGLIIFLSILGFCLAICYIFAAVKAISDRRKIKKAIEEHRRRSALEINNVYNHRDSRGGIISNNTAFIMETIIESDPLLTHDNSNNNSNQRLNQQINNNRSPYGSDNQVDYHHRSNHSLVPKRSLPAPPIGRVRKAISSQSMQKANSIGGYNDGEAAEEAYMVAKSAANHNQRRHHRKPNDWLVARSATANVLTATADQLRQHQRKSSATTTTTGVGGKLSIGGASATTDSSDPVDVSKSFDSIVRPNTRGSTHLSADEGGSGGSSSGGTSGNGSGGGLIDSQNLNTKFNLDNTTALNYNQYVDSSQSEENITAVVPSPPHLLKISNSSQKQQPIPFSPSAPEKILQFARQHNIPSIEIFHPTGYQRMDHDQQDDDNATTPDTTTSTTIIMDDIPSPVVLTLQSRSEECLLNTNNSSHSSEMELTSSDFDSDVPDSSDDDDDVEVSREGRKGKRKRGSGDDDNSLNIKLGSGKYLPLRNSDCSLEKSSNHLSQ